MTKKNTVNVPLYLTAAQKERLDQLAEQQTNGNRNALIINALIAYIPNFPQDKVARGEYAREHGYKSRSREQHIRNLFEMCSLTVETVEKVKPEKGGQYWRVVTTDGKIHEFKSGQEMRYLREAGYAKPNRTLTIILGDEE